jgi:N-acetylneuraminic acid mutarotase
MGSVTATAPLSVVTNAWVVTGSMSERRIEHTAALLPNGTVLVVGGAASTNNANAGYGTSSAEIYSPASGTWTLTGNLNSPRTAHTATLLPNRKVLVTGGINGNALSSSEIYDPSTGIWTLTGSMSTPRWRHTATLLQNGTVLVVGGEGTSSSYTVLASAEIFDPATGGWTPTGSLSTARYQHTATLLQNGTVMVTGGVAETFITILASSEIYDPVAGTWSITGSLNTARFDLTSTLLPNGAVLVAGGVDNANTQIDSSQTTGAEIYDPVAGVWSVTGSLNWGRDSHTATLLPNGTVLAAGGDVIPNNDTCIVPNGLCPPPTNLTSAELYDPSR